MFPVTTKGGGVCFAFPDVCNVPAPPGPNVPTPFPNTAQVPMANGGTCTTKVKILNMPVLHKGSEIPMTQGDEAGVAGGVVSGTIMDKAVYRSSIAKVKVEGNDVVTVLQMTAHNGSNANMPAGAQIAPSQTLVVVIP